MQTLIAYCLRQLCKGEDLSGARECLVRGKGVVTPMVEPPGGVSCIILSVTSLQPSTVHLQTPEMDDQPTAVFPAMFYR